MNEKEDLIWAALFLTLVTYFSYTLTKLFQALLGGLLP